MARAKRHYIPGQVWHLTHRCHKREFLLKHAMDRKRLLQWLYEAKKRYGLTILNYAVTSNHVHLLVFDEKGRNVIPDSMKLVAGRIGQEYNLRKNRKGAFWEDRYHTTAIETEKHLLRCIVYIDLNMIRANVVTHPSEWSFCGYNEIQKPRRKNVLIAYNKLAELTGFTAYDEFRKVHKENIDEALAHDNNGRQPHWTESIAVGGKEFIEVIKEKFGSMALGRNVHETGDLFELREHTVPYKSNFDSKNGDIEAVNTYLWGI